VLSEPTANVEDVLTQRPRRSAAMVVKPWEAIGRGVHKALEQSRLRLCQGRDRQQRGDLFAPQIKPLVQRAAARTRGQMQLRGADLPLAGQSERQSADQSLARPAAMPGEAHELGATERHDPLERPLDAVR
jgi:hypothetical protein